MTDGALSLQQRNEEDWHDINANRCLHGVRSEAHLTGGAVVQIPIVKVRLTQSPPRRILCLARRSHATGFFTDGYN